MSHAKLEQPECLRSEETFIGLMITHTSESYWIPSEKKKKSKLQIYRICQNFKYETDPISIVEDTERIRFCPQTDRRMDGQGETSKSPFNCFEAEGIIIHWPVS